MVFFIVGKDLVLSFAQVYYLVFVFGLGSQDVNRGFACHQKESFEKVCHRAPLGAYLQMFKLVARTEA